MENVCQELDDAKAELEKLKSEVKAKSELSETLKRAHYEQVTKIQEANAKIEKQSQELNEKEDEICVTKQLYEELKSSVKEKESIIKQLSSTNDKLRTNCDERINKLEKEKNELMEKLDEADSKTMGQEQELSAYKEEIRGLKSNLSCLEKKKCLEAKENVKASKELRQRDDVVYKLEEESQKVEGQLKWKKEQFKHLEEAHEKLRDQFKANEKKYETEISTLLDEILKLQEKLDTQIRISEGLQSRLQNCSQALAHEESRRKLLEVQLSETKSSFDSVLAECEDVKMETESLIGQRDKDVVNLRELLSTKEFHYKEMEHQVLRLERENEVLLSSLKEFQEAQIQEKGTASSLVSKLQNKLKGLQQIHRDCSENLRAKEVEWAIHSERMSNELMNCRSELEAKDKVIMGLKMRCEGLDLIHQDCSKNLTAKEAEWASQFERMDVDLANCRTELHSKDEHTKKLETKCEGLDRGYKEWTSQLEKMAGDLSICRAELESKDAVIKELGIKFEALDRIHGDCSSKLRSEEAQLTSQLESVARDLVNCRSEMETKDTVIKDLKRKCEALDLIHRDCSSKLRSEEAKSTIQLESLARDLANCKDELEHRDAMVKELQRKFEALDQVHQDCSVKLRAKEAECTSYSEKMVEELVECRTELESKDVIVKELREKIELLEQMHKEDCSKTLTAKEAEWAIILEAMEGDLSECKHELECKSDAVEKLKAEIGVLKQIKQIDNSAKLRAKEAEMDKMGRDLTECRYELESKDVVMKELQLALEDSNSSIMRLELQIEERSLMLMVLKCVISDMNINFSEREKQFVRAQNNIRRHDDEGTSKVKDELESELQKARNYLITANDELVEMCCERNELEFESQLWRSTAEGLSADLKELCNVRKELENSLLAQIEVEFALKHEKDNLVDSIQEKSKLIDCLEQQLKVCKIGSGNEIECLEQECLRRELEGVILVHMSAERMMKMKDEKIAKKQEELNMLLKSWEKIATDELAKEIEIQEKTLTIAEMEEDLINLQRKVDMQEKDGKKMAAKISAKREEVKEWKSELQYSENVIHKLESERRDLLEDVNRLVLEKDRMWDFIGNISERISSSSVEDKKLMSLLGQIVQKCDYKNDEVFHPSKENIDHPFGRKSVEATADGRSPLRALNN